MRSIGTVLTLIILVAIFVGAGTYYMADQKISKQKDELTKEIKDLRNKTTQIEQTASKVASDIESAKTATQTTQTTTPTATTSQEQVTTETANQAATVTTTTQIDTSKWKSFSSTNYNYSVKYPSDWEYKDTTSGTAMNAIGFKPKTTKDSYPFTVIVEKSSLDYSIGLVKKQLADNYTYKTKSTADIGGKTFTTLNFESKTTPAIKPVVYLIQIDSLVYHFTTANNSDANINTIVAEITKSFTLAAKTETKAP